MSELEKLETELQQIKIELAGDVSFVKVMELTAVEKELDQSILQITGTPKTETRPYRTGGRASEMRQVKRNEKLPIGGHNPLDIVNNDD